MSKPIDEEDEFEEFEEEDWGIQKQVSETGKNWTQDWEDAEWDDEDPDDSFQQRLREEIKKALERNIQNKGK
jgi:26 proteasome complex subunit DSS1